MTPGESDSELDDLPLSGSTFVQLLYTEPVAKMLQTEKSWNEQYGGLSQIWSHIMYNHFYYALAVPTD